MKNSDSALLVSCFAKNAILQTIEEKKDVGVVIKNENVKYILNLQFQGLKIDQLYKVERLKS